MSEIKLTADSGGGTTSLKAPSTTTSNADVVLKLPVADGSSGQVLKTDGSGQLSFGSDISDLVNDTSPQLGGSLDTNGNSISFADNIQAVFGTGNDSAVRFNGTDLVITTAGQIKSYAGSTGFEFLSNDNSETFAKFIKDGAVELYHNNSKKIETTSNGIKTSGRAEIDGNCFPYSDNNNDLGLAGNRWQDLYLSGNIYLGGTGSANALDDYEEGTFTPDWRGGQALGTTSYGTTNSASYTKIGRMVTVTGRTDITGSSGGQGFWFCRNMPFNVNSGGKGFNAAGSVSLENTNFANDTTYVIATMEQNNNHMHIRTVRDNASLGTGVSPSNGAMTVQWTITYQTA